MSELDDLFHLRHAIDRRIAEVGLREIAVVFVDLLKSTARLAQQDEVEAGAWLTAFHSHVSAAWAAQAPLFEKSQGDGMLACFANCRSGYDAGAAVLDALRKHNAETPRARQYAVRLAVHFGPAIVAGDALGFTVNAAKRIEECAPPDTLVVSEMVRKNLTPPQNLVPAGEVRVRGTPEVISVYVPQSAAGRRVTPSAGTTGADENDRTCVVCGRPILLSGSVIATCPGCEGAVCVGCRVKLAQREPPNCRTCGGPLSVGSSKQPAENCGFCGRRLDAQTESHMCGGPHCGSQTPICGACWCLGWTFCQDDVAAGLRGRHDSYDVPRGVSAPRARQMLAELPTRLEENLRGLEHWPTGAGDLQSVRSWRALEPVRRWGALAASLEGVIPGHIRLPGWRLDELRPLCVSSAAWGFEVAFDRRRVQIAMVAVVDAESLLLWGGVDCPLTAAALRDGLDTARNAWPQVAHVGLFSPVGWEAECWEHLPTLPGGSVVLVAPEDGTSHRVAGNDATLPAGLRLALRHLFDPESPHEKLERIRSYLESNLEKAALPPGLTVREVAQTLGLADPAPVRAAFRELCERDKTLVVQEADGDHHLLCR